MKPLGLRFSLTFIAAVTTASLFFASCYANVQDPSGNNSNPAKPVSECLNRIQNAIRAYTDDEPAAKWVDVNMDETDVLAEKLFRQNEASFQNFMQIQYEPCNNYTQLQSYIDQRTNALTRLKAAYTEIVEKSGSAQWRLASLVRIGMMYQDMAEDLIKVPIPEILKGDDQEDFQRKIDEFVSQSKRQAIQFYETVRNISQELNIETPFTSAAEEQFNAIVFNESDIHFNPKYVRDFVRQHSDDIRACYQQELPNTPNLSGTITVSWLISLDGSVTMTTIRESTLNNKNVEKCIQDTIQQWRFSERRPGGQNLYFTYSYSFGMD